VNHKQAMMMAMGQDEKLTATDFPDTIRVVHQDGSDMTFCNAKFDWLDKVWFAVWTEHTGVHVFYGGDVRYVDRIKRKNLFWNKED